MHRIMSRQGTATRRSGRQLRSLLLGAAAAAIFVDHHVRPVDSRARPAKPITSSRPPKGWVHPKTPWGEPDIQANLNMMQAAGVPLERCANATGSAARRAT